MVLVARRSKGTPLYMGDYFAPAWHADTSLSLRQMFVRKVGYYFCGRGVRQVTTAAPEQMQSGTFRQSVGNAN